jgi:cytochrome P450
MRWREGLPPGPTSGVIRQTLGLHRDPLAFLREQQTAHGDLFTLRLLTAKPLVVASDPGAVAQLLDSDPDRAHAGAGRRMILPFASTRSVFGADGEAHRRARRRIAKAMSVEAIAPHREEMVRIARRHASSWSDSRHFRLLERMRSVVDEIFVRLILGVRDEKIAVSLESAIRRMLETPGNPPVTLPGSGDGVVGGLGQRLFERRQAPVVRYLSRAVEARRTGSPRRMDVLGCILDDGPDLATPAIVEELMSLLMAAQEPPSIALTWVLDRLVADPELAGEFSVDPAGERADAIVRETLRLCPPASGVLRRLRGSMEIGDWMLPAGVTVLVSSLLCHRDSRVFAEPDRFRPDRWDQADDPESYFPFGGGARRCIGEHLAHAEIETVVPAILSTVGLAPSSARPESIVQRATVLVPKRGALVQASS